MGLLKFAINIVIGLNMKSMYRSLPIAVVFLLMSLVGFAQLNQIYVYGTVKDDRTKKKMSDVEVVLVEDGEVKKTFITAANGRFEFDLDYGHMYDIRFNKPNYVSKFITLNTASVPEEDQVGGEGMDLDMSLFKEVEGVNFDILKQPVGKADYDAAAGKVAFDYEYTKSIANEIGRLRRELEKKYREEEERLRQEQQAAEEQQRLQEQFDKLVAEGDQQFNQGFFPNAIFQYSEALELIPGVKHVEEKLARAKAALEEKQQKEEQEQRYKEAIAQADNAFNGEDFEQALAKYREALSIKPDEPYPQQQIDVTQQRLDLLAKQQALEEQYKNLIAKADGQFGSEDYQTAIATYQQALELKPNETYPKDQITAARGKLDEIAQQQALEEQYKNLIAKGDGQFGSEDYQNAIATYQQALELKPNETYPKDQITAARGKLDEIAQQQALEEQYKNLITEADGQFGSEDYQNAIATYQQALELKPGETYPKQQISTAQARLDELAKRQAKEEAYNKFISRADSQMEAEEYSAAINGYQKALELKPNESYPRDQVTAAQGKLDELAKQQALEEQYQQAIDKGDKAFDGEDYASAITAYQEASGLKPLETYPQDRLEASRQKLAEQEQLQALEEQYRNIVASADERLAASEYEEAISGYRQALELKPDEVYPKEKIAEAEQAMAEAKKAAELDKAYQDAVAAGDQKMTEEAYDGAIADYQRALEVKPDESYPAGQIEKARDALATIEQQRALEAQYNEILSRADQLFEEEKYESAISSYNQALGVKSDESYPKAQIQLAREAIKAREERKKLDAAYDAAVAYGDDQMSAENYLAAITSYENALGMKPDEQYPKDQIGKANAALEAQKARTAADQANSVLGEAADVPVEEEEKPEPTLESFKDIASFTEPEKSAPNEPAKEEEPEEEYVPLVQPKFTAGNEDAFRRELADKYPQGITKEVLKEGSKTIYRTIYVVQDYGDEFLKVTAPHGTYYFKNGSSLTMQEFNRQLDNLQ